jgi:hypothetical protein
MRAREFTINIPINIRIDGDDKKKRLRVSKRPPLGQEKLATNFVPPLQQKIELMKNAAGKQSGVIDQLTADEDEPGS